MNLKEKTIFEIKSIVKNYCSITQPTNVYLGFKKDINNPLLIETAYPIPNDNITVVISDINKDWQKPVSGSKDIGNPKIKSMSKQEFEHTFDILSYSVQEKSKLMMQLITAFDLQNNDHEGKIKRFNYYQ